ncbi:uncharacterized protein LOC120258569 [Dioscorea cayenensis subsp. rotundata]|uniref:Uncharacterized protein LOC120258569 n=1 Tax=Dioscorea cayennensis subsp. rotundata TaxID=55577 RepID=A0AB40B5D5_DIOCR|nr:uncharacterized protein LOC120258569 [Dioscorea cayenensis subsp. rotundata]
MSIDNPEDLLFSNLLETNGFFSASLISLFGNNFNWNCFENLNIEGGSNLWVWRFLSYKVSIASSVYEHASSSNITETPWLSWLIIWKLPTLPRVKIFLLKLAHRRLSTGEYLYQLNIGPKITCPLYGLADESAEHLIWNCCKIRHYWQDVWLLKNIYGRDVDLRAKAFIAFVAWIIWKSRCNLIFNNRPINFSSIVPNTWIVCYNRSTYTFREFPKTSHLNKSITIFTDASWCEESRSSSLGFIILSNMNHILIAGAKDAVTSSPIMAKFATINLALQFCISNGWLLSCLFCDCAGVAQLLKNFNVCTPWHIKDEYQILKRNLVFFPHLYIESIPKEENEIADALATFDRNSIQLFLFFQGLDRPQWLDDMCSLRHFTF